MGVCQECRFNQLLKKRFLKPLTLAWKRVVQSRKAFQPYWNKTKVLFTRKLKLSPLPTQSTTQSTTQLAFIAVKYWICNRTTKKIHQNATGNNLTNTSLSHSNDKRFHEQQRTEPDHSANPSESRDYKTLIYLPPAILYLQHLPELPSSLLKHKPSCFPSFGRYEEYHYIKLVLFRERKSCI